MRWGEGVRRRRGMVTVVVPAALNDRRPVQEVGAWVAVDFEYGHTQRRALADLAALDIGHTGFVCI